MKFFFIVDALVEPMLQPCNIAERHREGYRERRERETAVMQATECIGSRMNDVAEFR